MLGAMSFPALLPIFQFFLEWRHKVNSGDYCGPRTASRRRIRRFLRVTSAELAATSSELDPGTLMVRRRQDEVLRAGEFMVPIVSLAGQSAAQLVASSRAQRSAPSDQPTTGLLLLCLRLSRVDIASRSASSPTPLPNTRASA